MYTTPKIYDRVFWQKMFWDKVEKCRFKMVKAFLQRPSVRSAALDTAFQTGSVVNVLEHFQSQAIEMVDEEEKAIADTVEACIGAIWMDCKDWATVMKVLKGLGIIDRADGYDAFGKDRATHPCAPSIGSAVAAEESTIVESFWDARDGLSASFADVARFGTSRQPLGGDDCSELGGDTLQLVIRWAEKHFKNGYKVEDDDDVRIYEANQ